MLAVCALLDPCGHIPFFGFPLTLRADRCRRPLVGGLGVHGGVGLGGNVLGKFGEFFGRGVYACALP